MSLLAETQFTCSLEDTMDGRVHTQLRDTEKRRWEGGGGEGGGGVNVLSGSRLRRMIVILLHRRY